MMVVTEPETQLSFFNASPFNAETDFEDINRYFEHRSLEALLQWNLATFGDKMAQVTSFGPSGMVILDHLARLNPGMRVITLDTDFLFEETYALWEEVQRRYPIQLDIRRTSLSPQLQAETYGPELWQVNPDQCCHLRKVVPLYDTLVELDAWLSGLRRDQSRTRADLPLMMWDARYALVKINPLAHWTRGQVWRYILDHQVPYNPLHDQGYTSIGCTHCTRPVVNPGDERAGRWLGRQKVECGIHLPGGES
ncbi:MAG: phosphoadenylyl-sulfate reductase [Chloroflexota bacterium]